MKKKNRELVIPISKHVNHVWDLDLAGRGAAGLAAKKAGMPLKEFLRAFTEGELEPQPCGDLEQLDGHSIPAGFEFQPCTSKAIWSRVERVAEFDGMSVEMLVWRAICSWVDGAESEMIVHPKTRQPIGHKSEMRNEPGIFRLTSTNVCSEETARAVMVLEAAK